MKFIAEDDALTVQLEGMEMFFGLRRKLVLPRDKIVDLVWTPDFDYSSLLLRIGGTSLPKVLYAGNFRDIDNKETLFLYLRNPKGLPFKRTVEGANVLEITMQDFTYAKILLTCEPDIGASLMNWFRGL